MTTTTTKNTYTTLEQMANQFENETIKGLFIDAFKSSVKNFKGYGLDFKQANEMAFIFLIKEGAFERALIETYKN